MWYDFSILVPNYWNYCRVLLQASPLYIAEIAPREKRGIMTAFVNGFSTTGCVVRVNTSRGPVSQIID